VGITKYIRLFTPEDRKRFYLETEKGRPIRFVVQYETWLRRKWRPVIRYDTAHGYAHKDVLDRRDRVIQKTELKNIDYKKALDIADDDIEANWKTYKKDFSKRGK